MTLVVEQLEDFVKQKWVSLMLKFHSNLICCWSLVSCQSHAVRATARYCVILYNMRLPALSHIFLYFDNFLAKFSASLAFLLPTLV